MKPTKVLKEGKFEIHVFGNPSGAKAMDANARLRAIKENEEIQALRRLKNVYEDLGLDFLSSLQNSKIREITERLIKETCPDLIESVGYIEFPRKFSGAFWTYISLARHGTPIPSEVLEVWKKIKRGGLFQFFNIWHGKKEDKEDNLLIARAPFIEKDFLLVRWGEELRPFKELV